MMQFVEFWYFSLESALNIFCMPIDGKGYLLIHGRLMLKVSSSSISWGVFLIKMRPLYLTSSGWNLQRRKWSHIKHMFYLRNKCIKFSKYFARKKAFIFEIVSVYCVLEMASVSSLYHYFRFLDLVGLMSTNVKYIFVLEHKPKIILYRRSYLQQVEFCFFE